MGFKNTGNNNSIIILENNKERELTEEISGLDIEIDGDNNFIRIELPQNFSDSHLRICGDNNRFEMASSYLKMAGTFFYVADACCIRIGKNCFFNQDISIFAKEKKGTSIVIGDNVIIGTGSIVRCGDGHTLIMAGSGDPLNLPADIKIGDHVWIGSRCMLLKGATISKNSVVGAMSLVNKQFEEANVAIAGVPAKVIRRGINWDISSYTEYTEI